MRNYYVLLMILVIVSLGSIPDQNEIWEDTHSFIMKNKRKKRDKGKKTASV